MEKGVWNMEKGKRIKDKTKTKDKGKKIKDQTREMDKR